ncbi:hypothetical protein [Nocardioides ferulae]|uniref:hypothetical protein n=1 Tax=Nocardioides ferulae TaxID=2340821 RepID=UPI000EAE3567|nr:hypothetical protein [Nocardioides ferulae]
MRRGRATALVCGMLLSTVLVAGCSDDPAESYCEALEERQQRLSEIVGEGGPTALIEALGLFRELEERAPSDLADEWALLVRRIEVLEEALDDAGVDPATYDAQDPPAGIEPAERAAIAAAARELASEATLAALAGIEQQARDVCKTQLTL